MVDGSHWRWMVHGWFFLPPKMAAIEWQIDPFPNHLNLDSSDCLLSRIHFIAYGDLCHVESGRYKLQWTFYFHGHDWVSFKSFFRPRNTRGLNKKVNQKQKAKETDETGRCLIHFAASTSSNLHRKKIWAPQHWRRSQARAPCLRMNLWQDRLSRVHLKIVRLPKKKKMFVPHASFFLLKGQRLGGIPHSWQNPSNKF